MGVLLLLALALQQPDVEDLVRRASTGDAQAQSDLVDLGPSAVPALERAEKSATGDGATAIRKVLKEIRDFESGLESFDTADVAELTRRLDDRAARLQRRLSKSEGRAARVAAVVENEHGVRLKAADPYVLATYSFEFETRDDAKRTLNDWDFLLTGGKIRVRTLIDDRSLIWDLGDIDFGPLKFEGMPAPADTQAATRGRVYLVKTEDSNSYFWSKFRILERRPGQWMLFRWERIELAGDLLKLERTPDRVLKSCAARLQLRVGHGGGNAVRLHADGGITGFVDERSAAPLDMDRAMDQHERNIGYLEGGLIPFGKVWILRSARIKASIHEQGSFELTAKGKVLASMKRGGDKLALDETWKGRIVLRPGDERTLSAAAAFYSKFDVAFSGSLWDEKYADVETFPELKGADKERAEAGVKALEGDDAPARERAARELAEWGPPVLGYLQGLDLSKKSADAQARIRDVIRRIAGE